MNIISIAGSLIDRLSVVIGAFIGSQIPQFMQLYTQRLSGHVEALHKLVIQLTEMASLSHKTLEQYIQKFKNSTDMDFIQQGDFMHGIVTRWQELHSALDHLTQSPIWLRPYYFFNDIERDIFHATLDSYQIGFNLSLEGLCYIGAGMFCGWVFYRLFLKLIKMFIRIGDLTTILR